jgi:hypothetical protein
MLIGDTLLIGPTRFAIGADPPRLLECLMLLENDGRVQPDPKRGARQAYRRHIGHDRLRRIRPRIPLYLELPYTWHDALSFPHDGAVPAGQTKGSQ